MHVVDSLKLLQLYRQEYQHLDTYWLLTERCRQVMRELEEFARATGFAIHFYDPLESSDQHLWRQIAAATTRDLQEAKLRDAALAYFEEPRISAGMITGVNIALHNSLKLGAFPVTQERRLHDLTLRKLHSAVEALKHAEPAAASALNVMISQYHLTNLYSFQILEKVALPLAPLDEDRIAKLRRSGRFESFRTNLNEKVTSCVNRARDLLDMDELMSEAAAEIQHELRAYQQVLEEEIPRMHSDMLIDIGRDELAAPLAFMTGLAFGLPTAVICALSWAVVSASYEYLSFLMKRHERLGEFDPCCVFLFEVAGDPAEKERLMTRERTGLSLSDLKSVSDDKYGVLASTAMLYLWE